MRAFGAILTSCVLLAGLSGCVDTENGLFGPTAQSRGIRTLAVLDGDFSVRAPEGYCVDRKSSSGEHGFVVMAGCALVSRAQVMPQSDGLITVQVAEAGSALVSGSESELSDLLQTEDGRALLSVSGSGDDVTVDSVDRFSGRVEVRFTDASSDLVEGLVPGQWRAFLDVDGHLVTVTVRAYARAPLSENQGSGLLRAAIASISAANVDTDV